MHTDVEVERNAYLPEGLQEAAFAPQVIPRVADDLPGRQLRRAARLPQEEAEDRLGEGPGQLADPQHLAQAWIRCAPGHFRLCVCVKGLSGRVSMCELSNKPDPSRHTHLPLPSQSAHPHPHSHPSTRPPTQTQTHHHGQLVQPLRPLPALDARRRVHQARARGARARGRGLARRRGPGQRAHLGV